MSKARYIMIGGFLGAGKTTAVLKLARLLRDEGLRVGLITNDQSYGLVDTALLAAHDFPVEEITGGCFCCRFNSLVSAADRLSVDSRPDAFLAEPVGSCTDLKATVDYPLRRMYGNDYSISPLTVLIDPMRAQRILGLATGRSFSPRVVYVYTKQLEEADVIGINKIDLLSPDEIGELRRELERRFPNAVVITLSARNGIGIAEWANQPDRIAGRTGSAIDVDYDAYAEGEALLGWLNAAARLKSEVPFDGNALLTGIAERIRSRIHEGIGEVAHLKLVLTPDEQGNDLGVVNLVRNDARAEASHLLQDPLESGGLILNLRAEADPENLHRIVTDVLASLCRDASVEIRIEHIESFRPSRPTPTHRLAAV